MTPARWLALAAIAVFLAVGGVWLRRQHNTLSRITSAEPLLTILFANQNSQPEAFWRELLEPTARALNCALQVDGHRARLCTGSKVIELEAQTSLFAERGGVNWKAWPEGRGLSGIAVTVYSAPDQAWAARLAQGAQYVSPWAENGSLRRRAWLSALLTRSGATGVIVDVVGGRAWSATDWLFKLGNLEDAANVPLGAFTDFGPVEGDTTAFLLEGPSSAGLPNIYVQPSDVDGDDERWWRAQETSIWLYRRMLAEGWIPADGERVVTPVGAESPLWSLDGGQVNPELSETPNDAWLTRYGDTGRAIVMVAERPKPLTELLDAYLPYRMFAKLKLPITEAAHVGRLPGLKLEGSPTYEVFAFPAQGGVLVTTIGLGRWKQPGGTEANGNLRVEFALHLKEDSFEIARALSSFASLYAQRGDDPPWGAWHRISIAGMKIAPERYPWVVLRPSFEISMGGGQVVHVWAPVLVTQSERDAVPVGQIQAWLTDERFTVMSARWSELSSRDADGGL